MQDIYIKKEKLEKRLYELGSLAVALSGGVDSTFLMKTAKDVLGDKALAVTVKACMVPEREILLSGEFCASYGIKQIFAELDALSIEGFAKNPPDRCYHCKKALFSAICREAAANGFENVAEGSNTDDISDYRPGMKALSEAGILSPLKEAGLSKAEIRRLSKEADLSAWDRPSLACLATRFPYGDIITEEKLRMTDRAEEKLLSMGFDQVRVRVHRDMARIETLPGDFAKFTDKDLREEIYGFFRELGFKYTSLDLMGYRTGSMNEVLESPADNGDPAEGEKEKK